MADQILAPTTPLVIKSQIPDHIDAKGVVEAAHGVIPNDGKGFIPVTDFPPTKPYEDWKEYLKDWQGRLGDCIANPDEYIQRLLEDNENLKKARKDYEENYVRVLEKGSVNEIERHCEERLKDLKEYHGEVVQMKNGRIQELENDVKTLKTENDDIRRKYLDEINTLLNDRRKDIETYERELLDKLKEVDEQWERKWEAELRRLDADRSALNTERQSLVSIISSRITKWVWRPF